MHEPAHGVAALAIVNGAAGRDPDETRDLTVHTLIVAVEDSNGKIVAPHAPAETSHDLDHDAPRRPETSANPPYSRRWRAGRGRSGTSGRAISPQRHAASLRQIAQAPHGVAVADLPRTVHSPLTAASPQMPRSLLGSVPTCCPASRLTVPIPPPPVGPLTRPSTPLYHLAAKAIRPDTPASRREVRFRCS